MEPYVEHKGTVVTMRWTLACSLRVHSRNVLNRCLQSQNSSFLTRAYFQL